MNADVLPTYEASPGLTTVWLLERPFVAYVELLVLSGVEDRRRNEFIFRRSAPRHGSQE